MSTPSLTQSVFDKVVAERAETKVKKLKTDNTLTYIVFQMEKTNYNFFFSYVVRNVFGSTDAKSYVGFSCYGWESGDTE